MKENFALIIPAAGSGKRMKKDKNKVLMNLDNKSILLRSIESFLEIEEIKEIIIVLRKEDMEEIEKSLQSIITKKVSFVFGGNERQESIYNGIQAIDKNIEYVIIHDGARPFIKSEIIRETMNEAIRVGAAIVAVKSKDTVKIVSDKKVVSTLERNKLWNVQTPQIFKASVIKKVYNSASSDKIIATDDSSLVEHYGYSVAVIEGSYKNIKITTEEDLLFARAIISDEV